jgi:MOSC domain-containing protein YiiM
MEAVGKVISLFISTNESNTPIPKDQITVDKKGIQKDKHYNTDIARSILITSIQSYELLKGHGITVPYSTLGENMLIDYNPYHLPIGAQLQVGESILEISQNCTLCSHLAKADKRLPKLLKNDRGIFGKVVHQGTIKEGDTIYLLD